MKPNQSEVQGSKIVDDFALFFACWIRDGEWDLRIEGPHLNPPLGQRHIHLRHVKGRRGEYAWNADGSRHDKGKFPQNENGINQAKAIAARRLNVDVSTLRFITPLHNSEQIAVKIVGIQQDAYQEIKCANFQGAILANADWLIIMQNEIISTPE